MTDAREDAREDPVDRYGYRPSDYYTLGAEFLEDWLAVCRRLFFNRYAEWPAEVRQPNDKIWPGIWDYVPAAGRVTVLKCPKIQEFRGISIPSNAQTERTAGWIMTVSPLLMHQALNEPHESTLVNLPMFSHPLDLVGTAWLFSAHVGFPLQSNHLDRTFEGTMDQYRIDDAAGRILRMHAPK